MTRRVPCLPPRPSLARAAGVEGLPSAWPRRVLPVLSRGVPAAFCSAARHERRPRSAATRLTTEAPHVHSAMHAHLNDSALSSPLWVLRRADLQLCWAAALQRCALEDDQAARMFTPCLLSRDAPGQHMPSSAVSQPRDVRRHFGVSNRAMSGGDVPGPAASARPHNHLHSLSPSLTHHSACMHALTRAGSLSGPGVPFTHGTLGPSWPALRRALAASAHLYGRHHPKVCPL